MKMNLVLIIIHIFTLLITTNCYYGSEEKGSYDLEVVPPDFEPDSKKIEFSMRGDPFHIKISGHAKADGCDVKLSICNQGDCDKLFTKYLDDSDKYEFAFDEDDDGDLDDYLDEIRLCYEEEWDYCDPEMKIKLTSDCKSRAKFKVKVDYSVDLLPDNDDEDDDF